MKIVVNRSDALGDLLLTLPLAGRIKQINPKSKIAFIISPKCRELLLNHPWVDEFWVLEHGGIWQSLKYLLKCFHRFSPNIYFHVGGSYQPSFLAWLLCIRIRGGLLSRWPSFLFLNRGLRQSRGKAEKHEKEYNLELLKPLGLENSSVEGEVRDECCPQLYLTPQEIQIVWEDFQKTLKAKSFPIKELIVIHPGMSGHTVNWPAKNYGRLVVLLEQKFPGRFLYVIGHTPSDEPYVSPVWEYLQEHFPEKGAYFFNGALTGLRYYLGILSKASCVIAPSTGITHIANALGLKQIGLYGPIQVQSAKRWSPCRSWEGCRVLVPSVSCPELKTCVGSVCPEYDCMERITPERVVQEVEQII